MLAVPEPGVDLHRGEVDPVVISRDHPEPRPTREPISLPEAPLCSPLRHRLRNNPISLQAAPLAEAESEEFPAAGAEPDAEPRGGAVKAACDRPAEREEEAACLGGETAGLGPGGTKSKEEGSDSSSWAARRATVARSSATSLSRAATREPRLM